MPYDDLLSLDRDTSERLQAKAIRPVVDDDDSFIPAGTEKRAGEHDYLYYKHLSSNREQLLFLVRPSIGA